MNFSFLYDGKRYNACDLTRTGGNTRKQKDGVTVNTCVYSLGALRITRETRVYPFGAQYALLHFENVSDVSSKQLSDVRDLDETYEFDAPGLPLGYSGYGSDKYLMLGKMIGSNHSKDEFQMETKPVMDEIPPEFCCRGGRSSQGYAPFFELSLRNEGRLFALGWTGQWRVKITKNQSKTNVCAGVEGVDTFLKPGERIRTCSVLTMPFCGGLTDAHNKFKSIIKRFFTPHNVQNRELPFFTSFFGGSSTDFILRQINAMKNSKVPFECFWLDSGWYGEHKVLCDSEFDGRGGEQTGSWNVNTFVHPGGLDDVAKAVKDAGMEFMLWFEAEKAVQTSYNYRHRPQWHITLPDTHTTLLNLALPETQDYLIELISGYIERFSLSYYRQDFNMDPLPYWQAADPVGRKGMTQILYVTGMYRVWDALLQKYPHLIIDNCASGGRRIDLETLSRSVPCWRSDYQCAFDSDGETAQCHTSGISAWIPYSCTGVGLNVYDKYKFRSAYSAALNSNFFGYQHYADGELNETALLPLVEEFVSVRKYFSCDYYPIFGTPLDNYSWSGWQFDRPEHGDGIIMAFRRDKCPCDSATVLLGNISENKVYEFTDADGGETVRMSGAELKNGFTITLPQARSSKLIRYKAE